MFKIMLADDEGIVIDSLRMIIERNFKDSCIVEHAKTGRSVIELAERFRPDIAIMDIQMPGINGIEAMKEMKRLNMRTVFIVMSAFDKFDYAKEAINLGVIEYLNKPVAQTKVIEVLKKAMDMVETERNQRSNELLIREKLETVIPIIENGLIYDIMFQENFSEEVENFRTLLGITEDYGYMMIIVFGEDQRGSYMTNAVGTSLRLQGRYLEARVLIQEMFGGVVGAVIANKIPVFIPTEQKKLDYNERIEIIDRARELARRLKRQMDLRFRIGIGGIRKLHDSMMSYNEALRSLTETTGIVAHVDDLPIGCDYEEDYPVDVETALFDAVSSANLNETIHMANRYFDWMTERYPDCFTDIQLKALEFVLWAERIAYENGGLTYQFRGRQEYLPKLLSFQDTTALKSWFVEKVTEACRNIIAVKQSQSKNLVTIAKQYMDEHFTKDISLDDVSREANVSPYYFSKVFKEQTGENYIDYLTKLRIDKAKKLLQQTDMSMKEICLSIGYTDPNYFSRSFKKRVGVTPTDYKEGRYA